MERMILMMYDMYEHDLYALELQLLNEISKEKKFTLRKFFKLLELNAVLGR